MNGLNVVFLWLCCFRLQSAVGWEHLKDRTQQEGSPCQVSDGTNGTCKVGCNAIELVSDRRNICGFRKSDIILCCPDEKVEIEQRQSQAYPTLERVCEQRKLVEQRKREHKQELLSGQRLPPPKEGFGIPVRPNEHPHMAVLGWNTTSGGKDWFCGGALIHPSYVLTAAHCFDVNGVPVTVRVGGVNLHADSYNHYVVDYDVMEAIVHPGYHESEFYNDIALLRIEKIGPHSERPSPKISCVYLERDPPEKTLLTMGYGAPAFGRAYTYTLVKLNQTLLEKEECEKFYEPNLSLSYGITDTLICGHDPKNNHDTCEGDSGGPMQYNEKDWMKTPYVFAVVSFGAVCLTGTPGVYTRVHPYLDWIEETLSRDV